MLFWQKAFKSIAYGELQSARLFVTEMGMAKQCQLNNMMVLTAGHGGIQLGTKVTDSRILFTYVCVCIYVYIFMCILYKCFIVTTIKVIRNNIIILQLVKKMRKTE